MSTRSGASRRSQPPTSNSRPVDVKPPAYGKTVGKGGSIMITMDELDRIKNQVTKSNVEPYITLRNDDRQTLHETSKNRIKNWSNTIDAQRRKREEDRIKRLEDEEVSLKRQSLIPFHKFRSHAEKLMPRSRNSRMSLDASKLKKLTDSCTTRRTWSRPSSPRCWFLT